MNSSTVIVEEPRKSKSLAMQLVEKMSLQIRAGQLKVGQKLPTEAEIMRNFGVSRTVVREAISHLQASFWSKLGMALAPLCCRRSSALLFASVPIN